MRIDATEGLERSRDRLFNKSVFPHRTLAAAEVCYGECGEIFGCRREQLNYAKHRLGSGVREIDRRREDKLNLIENAIEFLVVAIRHQDPRAAGNFSESVTLPAG